MVRQIRRRDPDRPAFWYLSFCHPHPPLAPVRGYWDMYEGVEFPDPLEGDWLNGESCPPIIAAFREKFVHITRVDRQRALRAFAALCTQIDYELRLVLAAIREEGELDNTAIGFLSDHGDMLGHHGLWSKFLFYEGSARIPLVLVPPKCSPAPPRSGRDDRLAALQDVMPTLLDLAHIGIPDSVDGFSLLRSQRRDHLYGEHGPAQSAQASRMLRTPSHKLIYYPVGNRFQLFDMVTDPLESRDLSPDPSSAEVLSNLKDRLLDQLSQNDLSAWCPNGCFAGSNASVPASFSTPSLDLGLQRSLHWPPPR
jgi:arylsulfatase A-like enzyme